MRVTSSYIEVIDQNDRVVRKSGDKVTGNALVDATFDNLVKVDRFVRDVLGRKGWDNKDGALRARFSPGMGQNATFSDGTVILGLRPGADIALSCMGYSPGIVGHEVGHGMDYLESERDRSGPQSSHVEESFADIMGEAIDDDWVLGNEIPAGEPMPFGDLRDLRNPPARHLKDVDPNHIVGYDQLLSYTAALLSDTIGKSAMLKIWFNANLELPTRATGQTHPTNLADFAEAAVRAATKLHGADSVYAKAVAQAFATTGIRPSA